ncbi:MAG: metal-sensing transcriptional repressor [Firmicutes bacterium]|nr:metal-sensing transcriptional repressor [Bacillota bacterium]
MSEKISKSKELPADTKTEVHEHVHVDSEGNIHAHIHSEKEYKRLIHRISIIIGHMTSIKKMMEEKRDCSEILIQISAVQSSLNSLGKLILKNHINECLFNSDYEQDIFSKQKILGSLNDAIDKFVR